MKCSNCDKEMMYFTEGQCCGWKCPECGDALVTTYYSEFEMDNKEYSISVSENDAPNITKIKAISEIFNCNYLQAKAKLSAGFTISNASAGDAARIIKTLKNVGLLFNTTPEYPHKV